MTDLARRIDYSSTCPICAGGRLWTTLAFDEFRVLKCRDCGSSWRSNMYSAERIADMYTAQDYADLPYFSSQGPSSRRGGRLASYERALDRVESMIGRGRLLDVGCGAGTFLGVAKRRGWEVNGLEISPILAQTCRRDTNASVTVGSFEDASMPAHSYDLITLWDVLEHVIDPILWIDKTSAFLRPGGIALICTPDEDSLLARTACALYKLSWTVIRYPALALHPPTHTYFFTRRSLTRLLEERSLRVTRVYSQRAHFEHSPLASRLQKAAITLIEGLGALADIRYEMVLLAKGRARDDEALREATPKVARIGVGDCVSGGA
jgi:2-polyprenyl-3-methyl-5-hydroxy-6-metoxy-1,4-benzoquinol methylase